MNIDLSLTITSIIALIALISPILTCLINNHYDLKKRKIELSSNQKREALQQFIKYTLDYYAGTLTFTQMVNYTSSVNNLYLYFKSVDKSLLENLDNYRSDKKLEDYKQTLNKIVISLSKQIEDT